MSLQLEHGAGLLAEEIPTNRSDNGRMPAQQLECVVQRALIRACRHANAHAFLAVPMSTASACDVF